MECAQEMTRGLQAVEMEMANVNNNITAVNDKTEPCAMEEKVARIGDNKGTAYVLVWHEIGM